MINDALWGSIHLFPWEVAILDSHLLQRLRFIRQLGVIHWIYPTAGHSRLEHSLGALHQMGELIDGLERSSGRAGDLAVPDVDAKLLRIAALLHDCGHCLMSHVPELIIDDLPGVQELIRRMKTDYRTRSRPAASEAFAAVFIRSPAFQELLALPQVGADFIKDIDSATRQIASLVVGGPALEGRAFLTLLMNGPFDADKLDYMPRDCLMAGVPCAVDVRRIIEKVHCLDVPVTMLKEHGLEEHAMWAGAAEDSHVKILTLSSPGARALEELAITRGILFEKVYFHHKVRAAEAIARRALRKMDALTISQWLELSDDEVILDRRSRDLAVIRERRLPKRALSIAIPELDDPGRRASWRKLTGSLDRFGEAVQSEALAIAALLKSGGEELAAQPVEVDLPPIKKFELDLHAFVGDSVEQFAQVSSMRSGQRPEAGKRVGRQQVCVFAPEGAVLQTFIAAKKVLRQTYAWSVGADAYRATRLDPEAISDAEAELFAAGYYSAGEPPETTPPARLVSHREAALEAFLKTAWPRIEDLAVSFGRYQSGKSAPVSPMAIADFLRQFETERRGRAGLRMLEAVDFKDRGFFVQALTSRLEAAGADVETVCPLGSSGDSSALLMYLMSDVDQALQRCVKSFEIALEAETNGHLVLWDDFCGAAGHSLTTLCQWLGLTHEKALSEHLAEQLNPARTESLKRRRITITFALGRRSGIESLRSYLTALSLDNVQVLDPYEFVPETIPVFAEGSVIADTAARDDLRLFLQTAARDALSPRLRRSHRAWSEDMLADRVLGYGNGANLLVFYYNVPTVTLTALWVGGEGDQGWRPLFPRREKPDLVKPSA
ncbi:MAG TPA: HD domain-containing protein [Polyangiaceae bacterium]|nr:HD domain-containing protein [Polyangiaceae bacterium]